MKKIHYLFIIFCIFLSCEKYELEPTSSSPTNARLKSTYIETPFFNWDSTLNTIPYKPNLSPNLPWMGNSTTIPTDISYDHKKTDGWTSLYNFFMENETYPCLFLYNIYRGTVRVYYYHTVESKTGNLLQYNIDIEGENSILNFETKFPYPIDNNDSIRSIMKIASSTLDGLTNNHWYYFEFETSFDPNISQLSDQNNKINFSTQVSQVSNLLINGSQNGTIKGSINASSNSSLLSIGSLSFSNSKVTNTAHSIITSGEANGSDKAEETLLDKALEHAESGISNAIESAAGKIASNALSLITNPAASLFNSFIGAETSTNKSYANLKISTDINLTGTISTQYPNFNHKLNVPGTLHNGTGSWLPHYDKPLGVWNITHTPTIKWQEAYDKHEPWNQTSPIMYQQFYEIDNSSFSVLINPAINDSIENIQIKKDLFLLTKIDSIIQIDPIWRSRENSTPLGPELTYNSVRNRWYKLSSQKVLCYKRIDINPSVYDYYLNISNPTATPFNFGPDNRIHLRITLSFDIKSTGKRVIHVKTFKPSFTKDQTFRPVGSGHCIPLDMLIL